jgi:hypothetical protein
MILSMTQEELNKFYIARCLLDGKMTIREAAEVLDLRKANFSHFQELLEEHESISLSKPSVYRILVSNGFASPKEHRKV